MNAFEEIHKLLVQKGDLISRYNFLPYYWTPEVKEKIEDIVNSSLSDEDKAIELRLYVMKTQIFNDGNKMTAVIFANFYLISKRKGLLIIPFNNVPNFKKALVAYYEDSDNLSVKEFLKEYILSI